MASALPDWIQQWPQIGGASWPFGKDSLADQAHRRIEELIVTLELPPGHQISESSLSAELGIGRTPVREALKRLASEHLVEISPRRGIMVTDVSIEQVLLLLEVRRELERLVAHCAALRSTFEERKALRELADVMATVSAAGDYVTYLRLDREIHRLTAQCAHNPFLSSAITPLHALSRRFWFIYYKQADVLPVPGGLKTDILHAIAAGEPEAAEAAAEDLIDYAIIRTREQLDLRISTSRRRPHRLTAVSKLEQSDGRKPASRSKVKRS